MGGIVTRAAKEKRAEWQQAKLVSKNTEDNLLLSLEHEESSHSDYSERQTPAGVARVRVSEAPAERFFVEDEPSVLLYSDVCDEQCDFKKPAVEGELGDNTCRPCSTLDFIRSFSEPSTKPRLQLRGGMMLEQGRNCSPRTSPRSILRNGSLRTEASPRLSTQMPAQHNPKRRSLADERICEGSSRFPLVRPLSLPDIAAGMTDSGLSQMAAEELRCRFGADSNQSSSGLSEKPSDTLLRLQLEQSGLEEHDETH
jgi:hypothetical protein